MAKIRIEDYRKPVKPVEPVYPKYTYEQWLDAITRLDISRQRAAGKQTFTLTISGMYPEVQAAFKNGMTPAELLAQPLTDYSLSPDEVQALAA